MANNFVSARLRRRRIVELLKEQQRLDSACSEKLRIAVSSHTRRILKVISDRLMELTPEELGPDERISFGTLALPPLTLERWFELRGEESASAAELARLISLVHAAESEYDRLAPLGHLSGLFADKAADKEITAARLRRNALRAQRDVAQKMHQGRVKAIQDSAESLLRVAITPDGLRALLATSSIGEKLRDALNRMNLEITNLWTSHVRNQTESLEEVRSVTGDLLAIYERTAVNVSMPLPRGDNADPCN